MLTSSPGGEPRQTAASGQPKPTSVTTALDGPDGLLDRARQGDPSARETLLRRYSPYFLKIASRVTGTYLELGRDDEASVALMAFNEAIDSFDPGRGASFLGFARTVIGRRLIDHFRQTRPRRSEVPLSAVADAESLAGVWVDGRAADASGLQAANAEAAEWAYRDREEADERLDEVLRYREALAAYGITLGELVGLAPRHEDARRRAIEVARVLASRPDLLKHLRSKGELPLQALTGLTGVSRKTLERQRKYIIASALILTEDLPHLEAYLR